MFLLGFRRKKYSFYSVNALFGLYWNINVFIRVTALVVLKKWILEVININRGLKLKVYQFDNGKEFIGKAIKDHIKEYGIIL